MNILKTFVCPTPLDDTFLVYWTNSAIAPKGVLEMRLVTTYPAMRHLHDLPKAA